MKTIKLNNFEREIEAKIFEALIELGLKLSKILETNNECHFITLNKSYNKNLNKFSSPNSWCSPLFNQTALESVQMWTFILRPENSGRRIFGSFTTPSLMLYDNPLYCLN